MLSFNLKQLEVFVSVVECRSFSMASDSLYLSQPTVSAHIAALEAALGQKLLVRGSRKSTELTLAGESVYRQAKQILQACTALMQTAGNVQLLRVGASTVPMSCILPRKMAQFRSLNPQCIFEVRKANSDSVHELLLSGKLELGIIGTKRPENKLVYHSLCSDRLVLVTPNTAEYRQLQQQNCLGRSLLDRPMIVRTEGSGTQRAVEKYLLSCGIQPEKLSIAAKIETSEAILQAVEDGLGLAILSQMAAQPWINGKRILALQLEEKPVNREFYVVHRESPPLSSFAEAFLKFLLQTAAPGEST